MTRKPPQIFKPKSERPWTAADTTKKEAREFLQDKPKSRLATMFKRKKIGLKRLRTRLARRDWKKSLPRGRDETFSAPDASRQIIYGEMRTGGTLTFEHVKKADKKLLYQIYCLAGHEIDSVQKMWIDGIEIEFAVSGGSIYGWATGPTGSGAGTPDAAIARDFTDQVFVKIVRGTTTQAADSELLALLNYVPDGETDAVWTSAHRGRGVAYAIVIWKWKKETFGDGENNVEFLVRGKKVYDPRTAGTAWSKNAALCIADVWRDSAYGLGLAQAKLDMTDDEGGLEYAADVCDESVAVDGGGSESRYTISGIADFSQSPRQILESMYSAFAGTCAEIEGLIRFFPGDWRTPGGYTLTEDDLRGPVTIQNLQAKSDAFNCIKGTFIDAANNYEETDFPGIKSTTYIAADDGVEVWEDIQLPFTDSGTRAQRIARIMLEENRRSTTITATFSLRALQYRLFDIAPVTIARYGISAGTYRIMELRETTDSAGAPAVEMTLQVTDANAYSDSAEIASHQARVTILPGPSDVANPTGMTLQSGTSFLDIRLDGTIFSRIYASWTAVDDPFVTDGGKLQVQIKKSASATWVSMTDLPGDAAECWILDVKDGVAYDVRVRGVNALGIPSPAWVTVSNHTVIGKTAPPADVTGFAASLVDYKIRLVWDEVADLDLKHYEIRHGASWAAGTVVTRVKSNIFDWDMQAAGTFNLWIKAVDTSNNYSTNAATAAVTIAAPSAPTVTATIVGPDLVLTWTASTGNFPIRDYEIRHGSAWIGGTSIGVVKTTTHQLRVTWLGARTFRVAATDQAGNEGTAGTATVTITAPSAVTKLRAEVTNNNVQLFWSPNAGSLPVEQYEIRRGAIFAESTYLGKKLASVTVTQEMITGTYTYWILPIDTAGNYGPEASISCFVEDPPDFVLRYDEDLLVERGDSVNALCGIKDGTIFDAKPAEVDLQTAYKLWLDAGHGTALVPFSPMLHVATQPTVWWDFSDDAVVTQSATRTISAVANKGTAAAPLVQATEAAKFVRTRSDNRENGFYHSEDISQVSGSVYWVYSGAASNISATEFKELVSASSKYIYQYVPAYVSQNCRFRCKAKRGTGTRNLSISLATGSGGAASIDLSNGSVYSSSANVTATVTGPDSNGYYTITLLLAPASTATNPYVRLDIANETFTGYTGDGTSSIHVTEIQWQHADADSTYLGTTNFRYFRGLNGRAVAYASGAQYMDAVGSTIADLYAAGAKTIFAVAQAAQSADSYVLSSNTASTVSVFNGTSNRWMARNSDAGGTDTVTRSELVVNQAQVVEFMHSSGNISLKVNNGTADVVASDDTANLTTRPRVGAHTSGSYFTGRICEILTWNVALSAADRAAVYAYLAGKYSGTGFIAQHVSAIDDQEAITLDFTAATTEQPKLLPIGLNERPCLDFDGGDILESADQLYTIAAADEFVLYVAFEADASTTGTLFATGDNGVALVLDSGDLTASILSGSVNSVATAVTTGAPHIARMRLVDGVLYLKLDDGAEESTACGNIDAGALSWSTLVIGDLFDGRIACLVAGDTWSQYHDSLIMPLLKARYTMDPARLSTGDAVSSFFAPVNLTETWAEHFTDNSATCFQDLIDAGYTLWAQPTPGAGSVECLIDYGLVFGSNQIFVTWEQRQFGTAPDDVTCTISTSPDGSTWTAYADQTALFATNFRYVKIKLEVDGGDDTTLVQFSAINCRVRVKKVREGGIVTCTSGEATVLFENAFYDVISIVATPKGTGNSTVKVTWSDNPNPTSFDVEHYNSSGVLATGDVSYQIEGIVEGEA